MLVPVHACNKRLILLLADFASGSGHLGLAVAQLLPDSTVVLVDRKRVSLELAKQRAHASGITNVQFVCQDLLDPVPFSFQLGMVGCRMPLLLL